MERRGTSQNTKGSEPARGTHVLESAEGEKSQDSKEYERGKNTHFLERAGGGGDKSGERKKASQARRSPTAEDRGKERSK